MMIRLEMLGDDGEWHDVPGIASVQLEQMPPDDAYWRRHDALDSLVFLFEGIAEAQQPRVIDQNGNPVQPRPDRPAWQSPYGPSLRRH
ncbi:MAG: hypothetical protein HOV70_20180 [Streptomyces sp.]|nr:hypothetical protein [Streptomyces sp.]